MATVFESIPLNGLRKAHLNQLLWNLNQQECTGVYYGNYEQFMKRQEELIELITWARDYAYEDGVVLPKRIKEWGKG
jgi:ABC-type amino acid transport substrate-binding protein